MILSSLSFAFVGVMLRLAQSIPLAQKVFTRNLVVFIIMISILAIKRINPFARGTNYKLLIFRSLAGLGGVFCYFYSVEKLTLADAAILNKISPFFVLIFAVHFLNEKFHKYMLWAILMAFLGSFLVIKPSINFVNIPALIGLLGAVFSGAAYTLIRAMSGKEPANKIVFYFSMISLLATTPLLFFQFENPNSIELIGLIGTGIFATIGQIALTKSYHYTKATEVALYKYAHIIFAVITGYLFFKEMPDILSIIGGVIIIFAAVYQRNRMLKISEI